MSTNTMYIYCSTSPVQVESSPGTLWTDGTELFWLPGTLGTGGAKSFRIPRYPEDWRDSISFSPRYPVDWQDSVFSARTLWTGGTQSF